MVYIYIQPCCKAHTEAADPNVRNAVTHSKVSLTPKRSWVPLKSLTCICNTTFKVEALKTTFCAWWQRQVANNIEQLVLVWKHPWTRYRTIRVAWWWFLVPCIARIPSVCSTDCLSKQRAETSSTTQTATWTTPCFLKQSTHAQQFRMDKRALRMMMSMYHEQLYLWEHFDSCNWTRWCRIEWWWCCGTLWCTFAAYSLLEHNPINVQHVTLSGTTLWLWTTPTLAMSSWLFFAQHDSDCSLCCDHWLHH